MSVFEYVISLLHVHLFSPTFSFSFPFSLSRSLCVYLALFTSFILFVFGKVFISTKLRCYCFFMRRHDIFQFYLFFSVRVKFFLFLTWSLSENNKQCACFEHWTESILRMQTQGVRHRRALKCLVATSTAEQPNRLEQLARTFFFRCHSVDTNCFFIAHKLVGSVYKPHIKLENYA